MLALLSFPGSNCEADCLTVLEGHYRQRVHIYRYTERTLDRNTRGIIIPGGFSYGDYLRAGALASRSPIVTELCRFAARGGAILGICNGFQILTELRLLPGVLLPNAGGKFIAKPVTLLGYDVSLPGKLVMPIAHAQGRYYVADTRPLEDKGQVALRYEVNPNGSCADIAAVWSENRKIMGLMPHPERAWNIYLGGSTAGLKVWDNFLATCL